MALDKWRTAAERGVPISQGSCRQEAGQQDQTLNSSKEPSLFNEVHECVPDT
jgi:hypothetical protein